MSRRWHSTWSPVLPFKTLWISKNLEFPAPKHTDYYKPGYSDYCKGLYTSKFESGAFQVSTGKGPACQRRWHKRCRFNSCVRTIPWRKKWQPTPVFFPGNPKDRETWQAIVHSVTQSWIWLKLLSMHTLALYMGQVRVSWVSFDLSMPSSTSSYSAVATSIPLECKPHEIRTLWFIDGSQVSRTRPGT